MAKTRRAYTGAAVSTTTASSIAASGTTSFTITAYTGWPYGTDPFYVVVEPGTASEEKILVTRTGSTDTTINVASDSVRGQDGTSAVSHNTGSTVFPVFTSVDADEANELASKWSAKGDLVSYGSSTFEKLAVGSNGALLMADSSATSGLKWAQPGYTYVQTVYFTSSGTFTKASYPWLRAVKVIVVGGGGGGGRGQTASSSGGGGGSGAYCEQWFAASALGASETVTIGAGGAGTGGGGGSIDGIGGGASSFGSLISCGGGGGGGGSVDASSRVVNGGGGGVVTASGSYVAVIGGRGEYGITNYGLPGLPGFGGSNPLGNGGVTSHSAPATGTGGYGYGSGGSGGLGAGASQTRDGGGGASGIVILELFA